MALIDRSNRWFFWMCAGRIGQSMIFTAYSAVLPFVAADWHMTSAQAGSVQSAWHAGYLVSLFVAGFLADRFGAKKTLVRMNGFAAAAAMMFAVFSRSHLSAALLYGLAGLLSGGSYTPGLKLIFQRAGPASSGAAMGLFLASGSIGYALALMVSAVVVPIAGWRVALVVCACAVALGAVVVILALRTVSETDTIPETAGPSRGWSELATNRGAIACILAYTFHCWELLGMWAWLPGFVVSTQAGGAGRAASYGLIIVAVSHLLSSLGSVIGGRLSDSFGRPMVMLVMTGASLTCSFGIGWLVGAPVAVIVAVVIAYNLFAIADSAVYSTALAEVVPAGRQGAAYSIRSVLGFGAGAVSPWVFGSVLDLGHSGMVTPATAWGLAWTTLAVGGLPGIAMILWFKKAAPPSLITRG
jgi:MFS family permease